MTPPGGTVGPYAKARAAGAGPAPDPRPGPRPGNDATPAGFLQSAPDPIELAVVLGRILDRLGVPYCIGGSAASSVYDDVRTTLDVDVVVNLQTHHVGPFVAATEPDFHVLEVLEVRRCTVDRL